MIEEQALEEKLHQVSFATLGHFLEEGFLSHSVGSRVSGIKMIGRARTVRVVNADAFAVNRALVSLQPGEVLVIEMVADHQHACVGTVTTTAAMAQGARGIVVDGVVTDIVELQAAGLPIFARGTSLLTTKLQSDPASAQNVEIRCGGIAVMPGDWVLGDDNGLLITSTQVLLGIIDTALASDAAEPALLERMRNGEPLAQVLRLD